MSMTLKILKDVLDLSVSRHGAGTPVTLGHLRNIVNYALQAQVRTEDRREKFLDRLAGEMRMLEIEEGD